MMEWLTDLSANLATPLGLTAAMALLAMSVRCLWAVGVPSVAGVACGALAGYLAGTPVVWVQDEPENMGAWRFLRIHLGDKLFERLPFSGVCRQSAASPATGSKKSHDLEQNELLSAAFSS